MKKQEARIRRRGRELDVEDMSCIRLSIGCTCKVGTCSGAVDVEWRWCLLTRLHDVNGVDGTDRAPCQENEHMFHSQPLLLLLHSSDRPSSVA